jgi:hypothetical protein
VTVVRQLAHATGGEAHAVLMVLDFFGNADVHDESSSFKSLMLGRLPSQVRALNAWENPIFTQLPAVY